MRTQSKRPNRILSAVLFALAFPLISNAAQPPPVEWQKTYGAPDEQSPLGVYSVQQTSDGGYVFVGFSQPSSSVAGAWLVKTDAQGNQQWEKRGMNSGEFLCVQQTADGGYVMTGGTGTEASLTKTDPDGNLQWFRTYEYDVGVFVRQTTDGGYVVAGQAYVAQTFKAYLLKTDANGYEQWARIFRAGITNYSLAQCVQQTRDGGYVVAARVPGAYLLKTDANGNTEWDKFYGTVYLLAVFRRVQQTFDGGYIALGYFNTSSGSSYGWLVKTDAQGTVQWEKSFAGFDPVSVQQTTEGGYVLGGSMPSASRRSQLYLLKTDAGGNKEWEMVFGGTSEYYGGNTQQTSDRGFIVLGCLYSAPNPPKAVLIKLAREMPPSAVRWSWRLYR
jgi:hypothetical protein